MAPSVFDPTAAWTLSPTVSLRPEPFGALAYDFKSRRLSFLKTRTIVRVVEGLETFPSAREAIQAAGVPNIEASAYIAALARLAEAGLISRRPST